MNYYLAFIVLSGIAIAGCDGQSQRQAEAANPPAAQLSQDTGLIAGTPPGDLEDWVRDIRTGMADVPALVRSAPADAQRITLDLYVTRQEYAEMYYGVDGRLRATDELANAIEAAEERFHELMQLLTGPAPSADSVAEAALALDKQQALVLEAWKSSGARLPPRAQ